MYVDMFISAYVYKTSWAGPLQRRTCNEDEKAAGSQFELSAGWMKQKIHRLEKKHGQNFRSIQRPHQS